MVDKINLHRPWHMININFASHPNRISTDRASKFFTKLFYRSKRSSNILSYKNLSKQTSLIAAHLHVTGQILPPLVSKLFNLSNVRRNFWAQLICNNVREEPFEHR